jgi:predicted nucleic acid-binding protein
MNIMRGLQGSINSDFVISRGVFDEIVERPMQIRRFEMNASRIDKAVHDGWIKVRELSSSSMAKVPQIMGLANSSFFIEGKPLRLIHNGEAETLALVLELGAAAMIIDERTTRSLIETPEALKSLMESRYETKITADWGRLGEFRQMFKGLNIARSVELIALANEHGLLEQELYGGKKALEAALFAAKYSGCAVSTNEIEEFVKSV